jgi:hypothetical protein
LGDIPELKGDSHEENGIILPSVTLLYEQAIAPRVSPIWDSKIFVFSVDSAAGLRIFSNKRESRTSLRCKRSIPESLTGSS